MQRFPIVATSFFAIAAFAAAPAYAQGADIPAADEAAQGDEIIVTGTRAVLDDARQSR